MGNRILILLALFVIFSGADLIVISDHVANVDVDSRGNLFIVTKEGVIEKRNPKNELLVQQNIQADGMVTTIDVSNPFEIYLYYEEQGQLVFKDNQLSERGRISMLDYFSNLPSTVIRSFDNGLWIYNIDEQRLERRNKNMALTAESPQIPLLLGHPVDVQQLVESNEHVFLLDSARGVFQFDFFGNFQRHWRFKGAKDLSRWKKGYAILVGKDVLFHQPDLFKTDTLFSLSETAHQLTTAQGRIIALTKTGRLLELK